MKTAIFVEGQTELIFTREFLLKIFEYQNINIECFNLFSESKFHPTEYAYPNPNAEYYFQIINVGNDNAVLSRILKREKHMWDCGYDRIIGLRDMYSKEYREAVKSPQIDLMVNKKFIEGAITQINKLATKASQISFIFAIMEIESWFLGLYKSFEGLNNSLTVEYIEEKLNFNLRNIDPEEHFFHPSKDIDKIYQLAEKKYDKKKGDVSAIVSYMVKEYFEELHQENKCNSYSKFFTEVNVS